MSDGAFPDRLTQLRNRWESDPTSRIFLQLAEEYRHQGRVREALDVLDKGLKEHPGYLSALVAKGRCLLELDEPEGARTVLERVVKQDATQMVANKLLVRAYLDTGDPDRARERLDLYTLLNDSDPEIEELRRRIRAMDQAPQAVRPDPKQRLDAPFPDLAVPAPPAPRREPSGVFDVFELAGPAPPPRRQVEDVFALEPAPPPAATFEPAAVALAEPEPEPEPEDGDVFPGLGTRARRRRYAEALESEGLFSFGPAPAAVAPPPSPVAAPEPEPALAVEELPFVEAAAPWAPAPPAVVEEEAPVFEVEAPSPVAEELPVFELEEPAPWAAEPVSLVPEADMLPTPIEPAPVATATLGELYLRQGHLEEAERIFHEVLSREPGNAAAQVGLARLASRTAEPVAEPEPAAPPVAAERPLESGQLLAGFEPAAGAAGVNARKAYVLRQYLQRIREGSQRHVP